MKYTGWRLYDRVIIVEKEESQGYEYPQAYVVDYGNDKQLVSAYNWAKGYKSEYSIQEYMEKYSYTLDNKDFTLEIYAGPKGSYQGGKLSFSNCVISHGDKKWTIGINTEWLMSLIKQSLFKMGKCEHKLMFARNNGNVALIHKEMTEYKDSISDAETRKNSGKKKTSKWEIGKTYDTLTLSSLYLGKVLRKITVDRQSIERKDYLDYKRFYTYAYCISKKAKIMNLIIDTSHLIKILGLSENDICVKASNILNTYKTKLIDAEKKEIEYVNNHNKDNDYKIKFKHNYEATRIMNLFIPTEYNSSFASRQQGEFEVIFDISVEELLTEIYKINREYVERHIEAFEPYTICDIIITPNTEDINIGKKDIQLLNEYIKNFNTKSRSETVELRIE